MSNKSLRDRASDVIDGGADIGAAFTVVLFAGWLARDWPQELATCSGGATAALMLIGYWVRPSDPDGDEDAAVDPDVAAWMDENPAGEQPKEADK